MPRLDPVPGGKIKVSASWFKKARDRIEEIKPLDGRFISTRQTQDGIVINADSVINLQVCVDGIPATVTVVGTM